MREFDLYGLRRADLLEYSHWQMEEFQLSPARRRLEALDRLLLLGAPDSLSAERFGRFGLRTPFDKVAVNLWFCVVLR